MDQSFFQKTHAAHQNSSLDRSVMRIGQVTRLVGLSRSWVYDAMSRGEFPQQIKLSRRAVAWRSTEVYNWLDSLK